MGLIYKSVLDKYLDFTKPLEGVVQWMYLDVDGWVTTGIGNLIDAGKTKWKPAPGDEKPALALPWADRKTKKKVTDKTVITTEWNLIKGKKDLATGGWVEAGKVATLELSMADVLDLVSKKLESNAVELAKGFPGFKDFPADAQLGMLSMAWAMGAGYATTWKNFIKAVNKKTDGQADPDWDAASKECFMKGKGIEKRNDADKQLFLNALAVDADDNVDNSTLVWPKKGTLEKGKLVIK
jgi:GH24 family phage-related lysozyme (muramidase)